ncbi:MAG TPA: plastocyanin/azurin family copper-binding protein [Magnetospirillaceae bacterium]|nr:plastocyanin/azurin family copper-binding protein [Magnetospirillaceae bacterium]
MKRVGLIIAVIIIVGGGIALGIWVTRPQTVPENTSQNTSTGTDGPASDLPASEVTVHMQNTRFSPATLTIKKGTKVTWVNDDFVQHNVVADEANNSGGLPTQNPVFGKGGSYSFTFDSVGTFPYHCTPHASQMTGTIVVE